MSFSSNGVQLNVWKKKSWLFSFAVRAAELVLSVMFIIALGGVALMPHDSKAALGVSNILSYQGRLTDASGNPLGGSGTNYCAAFSIWDASSGGTKLWPTATSSTTILVTNGVFNTGIGLADDLSTYNFYDNNTTYLEVDVASQVGGTCTGVSWEALAPRPRMDAAAYARVARDVYGDLLRTDNANGRVQVGTAGTNPTLLLLGTKNLADSTLSYVGQTCTTNGTMWYNSATTHSLLCENGFVKALANATTTIDALLPAGNLDVAATAITNGTITLAGGNNITLSQNGNALTIRAGAGIPGIAGSGASTVTNGTLQFANANNISFGLNGSTMTASFSQSAQTQNLHNMTLSGNTAGVMAQVSSGTMTLAGGNNITLSQNGNAITISGGAGGGGAGISAGTQSVATGTVIFSNANNVSFGMAGSQTITASIPSIHNVTMGGNSTSAGAGYIQISSGTMLLAGGNNITLSQNGASITISAFNQTVQTQNLHNMTLAGNTAGVMAQISSGTLTLAGGNNITLSQNGNAITISGGAGGGGAAISAAGNSVSNGTVIFSNANGVSFGMAGSTITATVTPGAAAGIAALGANTQTATSGTILFSNANGVSFGLNNQTITASVGGGAAPVLNYYDNMPSGATNSGGAGSLAFTGSHRSLFVMPFNGFYHPFPGDITANTAHLNLSISGSTATMSAVFTSNFYLGIYTLNTAQSSLSLLNSANISFAQNPAATNNSTAFVGQRFLSIHSSVWSSQPVFKYGSQYWLGYFWSSAGALNQTGGLLGFYRYSTAQRWGTITPAASNTATSMGWAPFYGIYTATTAALPTAINRTELNKVNANAGFTPHVIFNASAQSAF
ncbi:hypothetical protein HY839_00940 [Candidatus Azambacteria bacterium]|nr:hypothetical protein [Candidatus Azambacteria bacterium]